mmetsp:Transcript_26693/g.61428  ORF Transcript_26693/g.61428 Transcript_26693/m.61428 type:complete len:392 (+) Transcript_26693:71-1246(+)
MPSPARYGSTSTLYSRLVALLLLSLPALLEADPDLDHVSACPICDHAGSCGRQAPHRGMAALQTTTNNSKVLAALSHQVEFNSTDVGSQAELWLMSWLNRGDATAPSHVRSSFVALLAVQDGDGNFAALALVLLMLLLVCAAILLLIARTRVKHGEHGSQEFHFTDPPLLAESDHRRLQHEVSNSPSLLLFEPLRVENPKGSTIVLEGRLSSQPQEDELAVLHGLGGQALLRVLVSETTTQGSGIIIQSILDSPVAYMDTFQAMHAAGKSVDVYAHAPDGSREFFGIIEVMHGSLLTFHRACLAKSPPGTAASLARGHTQKRRGNAEVHRQDLLLAMQGTATGCNFTDPTHALVGSMEVTGTTRVLHLNMGVDASMILCMAIASIKLNCQR